MGSEMCIRDSVNTVGAIDIDDMTGEFRRTIEIIEASGILDQ